MVDDRDLVARAQRGDDHAFELIVRRHTDTVWRFARRMVADDATAEEIVQDTFVKAYRALGRFRGDAAITTWLYTICHRVCLDGRRRAHVDVVTLDAACEADAHAVLAREHSVDDRLSLDAAMSSLPDDERVAFTLVGVLGYSHEEAGAVAGAPSSTMRSRYARARTRLATALQPDERELG
ncbi:MAG TPA: sigma-70 family RNA polymerase sigma factor [Acidimicrobiales bacterium]